MVMVLQSPGTRCWSWDPPGPAAWYDTTYSVAAPGLSHASSMEPSLIPVTRRFSGGTTDGEREGEHQDVHDLSSSHGVWVCWLDMGKGSCLGVMCSQVLLQGKGSGEPACTAIVKVDHHQYLDKTQWLFACLPNLYASLADGNNRQAVKLWDVSTKCSASYGFLPCCVVLLWDSGNFVSPSHTIRSDSPHTPLLPAEQSCPP